MPVTVIIADENDNKPTFQQTPYKTSVFEDMPLGAVAFSIEVKDVDSVGDVLDASLLSEPNEDLWFNLNITESSQNKLLANIVLSNSLNYNEKKLHQLNLITTDGLHSSSIIANIYVRDVQNSPPIFKSPPIITVNENLEVGSVLAKIYASDGDTELPRAIVYDILESPMDVFSLDEKTGRLTATRVLDRAFLDFNVDATRIVVRGREIFNGQPLNDSQSSTMQTIQIQIKNQKKNHPVFNAMQYFVNLKENSPMGSLLTTTRPTGFSK